ncbi:MAG: NlpC/P60 family protein [Prevotella sp.]|jgi:hypothetical protein|nr:NlpC/P60 family protein [Prevotella sp.]MCI1282716.1 NlpC/P60 family protein [Prevotella sp.]
MKKIRKGCLWTLGIILLIPILLWIGTRNLSNTHGSAVVQRAEACSEPNNDFSHCTNPSIARSACKNYPTSGKFHPLTCINTATSFYNKSDNCSYCPDFVRMPMKWGFHEVKASQRKPGDLIIFYHGSTASHAAIYIGESLLGPLMDQSDGWFHSFDYQKHVPYGIFSKFFYTKARYYRYTF